MEFRLNKFKFDKIKRSISNKIELNEKNNDKTHLSNITGNHTV